MEEQILSILEEITGTDEVRKNRDIDLFDEGLLDSLASVQLLVELDGELDIQVLYLNSSERIGAHRIKSFNKQLH